MKKTTKFFTLVENPCLITINEVIIFKTKNRTKYSIFLAFKYAFLIKRLYNPKNTPISVIIAVTILLAEIN